MAPSSARTYVAIVAKMHSVAMPAEAKSAVGERRREDICSGKTAARKNTTIEPICINVKSPNTFDGETKS